MYDGSAWVTPDVRYYTGTGWTTKVPQVQMWDGNGWQGSSPTARAFPVFAGSNSREYAGPRYVSLPVPQEARVMDFVVSVCANRSTIPQLVHPALRTLPQTYTYTEDGVYFSAAAFPYLGTDDGPVIWDLGERAKQGVVINMVYRYGDVTNRSVTPVSAGWTFRNVSEIPLMPAKKHTSIFAAVVFAKDFSSFRWPEGVTPREARKATFGKVGISIVTADTSRVGASPGNLLLNTKTPLAGLYLITIPGRDEARPT
ncbi:hypothetical protein [Streptomyces chattanoogensis]|uniref:hypothetical protein n=1 Tax=Streptomyces chattanoogensis TaxID=66876 RepID=UPI0036BE4151